CNPSSLDRDNEVDLVVLLVVGDALADDDEVFGLKLVGKRLPDRALSAVGPCVRANNHQGAVDCVASSITLLRLWGARSLATSSGSVSCGAGRAPGLSKATTWELLIVPAAPNLPAVRTGGEQQTARA